MCCSDGDRGHEHDSSAPSCDLQRKLRWRTSMMCLLTSSRALRRCVVDFKPRKFDAECCNILANFAEMVVRDVERYSAEEERSGLHQQLTLAQARAAPLQCVLGQLRRHCIYADAVCAVVFSWCIQLVITLALQSRLTLSSLSAHRLVCHGVARRLAHLLCSMIRSAQLASGSTTHGLHCAAASQPGARAGD